MLVISKKRNFQLINFDDIKKSDPLKFPTGIYGYPHRIRCLLEKLRDDNKLGISDLTGAPSQKLYALEVLRNRCQKHSIELTIRLCTTKATLVYGS